MSENKKWYAVYTRPRWEKKVAETLTHKKIECYCPINKVVRQWSDRKKIVHEPLFTSYVFVRIPETGLTSLRQTHGVINLVYWLGKPALIRDVEIDIIKRFLNEHVNIQLEKTPINVNDKVRILGGPLMEMEGQVLSLKNRTIKVALPSLGYMMFAEVETSNVEVTQHSGATEIEMHYPLHAAR
ncbi:MAG: UpxY family transcription antiterminator [Bacteroidetes bacterium]|nr:UpxY family transcription antiterminator [Bacteroidota bacterium]